MSFFEPLESRLLYSASAAGHVAHRMHDGIWRAVHTRAASTISTIKFSGYTWNVRGDFGGPGPNTFSNSTKSVFVDAAGRLHLEVAQLNGVWTSSEVYLNNSLGYGTYRYDVASRVDLTDRNLTSSGFIYATDTKEYDIEFSKWGDPTSPTNADFAIQPDTAPRALDNFHETAPGVSTYKIIWSPGKVELTASFGSKILQDWTYTGPNVFVPGPEVFHFNHWINTGGKPSNGKWEDFVIQDFRFTPMGK